jgi:DNA polymerase III subunit delta'
MRCVPFVETRRRAPPMRPARRAGVTGPTPLPFDAPLPWLAEDWMRLDQARADGRLAHGLLISGPRGIGKRHLVELLARSMLCGAPTADGLACGRCADCALIAAESHPDLLRVGPDPEAKSEEIPVAAIRALVERGALTPSRAAWKVTLADPRIISTPPRRTPCSRPSRSRRGPRSSS